MYSICLCYCTYTCTLPPAGPFTTMYAYPTAINCVLQIISIPHCKIIIDDLHVIIMVCMVIPYWTKLHIFYKACSQDFDVLRHSECYIGTRLIYTFSQRAQIVTIDFLGYSVPPKMCQFLNILALEAALY